MPNCFVPSCRTSSENETQEQSPETGKPPLSLFPAPLETSVFHKWQVLISRKDKKLTREDFVCELHFNKHCIDRSEREPTLRPGSLPTIFPPSSAGPPQIPLEKTTPMEHLMPAKRKSQEVEDPDSKLKQNRQKVKEHEATVMLCQGGVEVGSLQIRIEEIEEQPDEGKLTIETLFERLHPILDADWSCTMWNNKIIVQKWGVYFESVRKLIIFEDLQVKAFIKETEILVPQLHDDNDIVTIKSVDEVCSVLSFLSSVKICQSTVIKRCRGYVRPGDDICGSCESARKSIKRYAMQLERAKHSLARVTKKKDELQDEISIMRGLKSSLGRNCHLF